MATDLTSQRRASPEIHRHGRWEAVPFSVFRSWCGRRRLGGRPYHGPVFDYGTTTEVRPSRVNDAVLFGVSR